MATIARQPNGLHPDVMALAGEAADRQHIALWQ